MAHLLRDIDAVYEAVQRLEEGVPRPAVMAPPADPRPGPRPGTGRGTGGARSFSRTPTAWWWTPASLVAILRHLQDRFPEVTRVTSYARSSTIANLEAGALAALRHAGLNRIHIGMESGADAVLKLVRKGTTQRMHILAGLKVKDAGMELSEYYMPGLGGRAAAGSQRPGDGRGPESDQPGFHPAAHPGPPAGYAPV